MKNLSKLVLFITVIFSAKISATTIDFECSYHRIYTNDVIKKSNEYLKNHPSTTEENIIYAESKYNMEENKSHTLFREKISIDLANKSIMGNLDSWIVPNHLIPEIEEFSDKLFIDYFSSSNVPVMKIDIDRVTGAIHGIKFVSAPSLEPIFHLGEIDYFIDGKCQPIKIKKII